MAKRRVKIKTVQKRDNNKKIGKKNPKNKNWQHLKNRGKKAQIWQKKGRQTKIGKI